MGFEKKLYDFEATPPPAAWDKIAETLNGLQLEGGLKKKLQHLSQNPPGGTWAAIEKNLNTYSEEVISEKLSALSEEPPAGAWNHISDELVTDELSKKIAGKFSGLEVNTPPHAWNRITAELDRSSKVVPMFQKYARVFRLVAAAAVIGLMVWAGTWLFNSRSSAIADEPVAKKTTVAPAADQNVSPKTEIKPDNTENKIASNNEVQKIAVYTQKKRSNSAAANRNADKTEELMVSVPAVNIHTSSEEITADLNSLGRNKKTGLTNEAGNTAPRYLVYLNNEGSLMKISKKLADLKCIYTKDGEVSQNALAVLDRTICNDLVKSWQEKLANSPTNFSFNPLELADILK